MLLSDIDIAKRLVDTDLTRRLVVTPIISMKDQLGPSSLDVRLSTDFQRLENMNRSHVGLTKAAARRGRGLHQASNLGVRRILLSSPGGICSCLNT